MGTMDMEENNINEAVPGATGLDMAAWGLVAGALGLAGKKAFDALSPKKRREAAEKKLQDIVNKFDTKISTIDDKISDLEDANSDLNDVKSKADDSKKQQISKKIEANKLQIEKLEDLKRDLKDKKRKAKDKILGPAIKSMQNKRKKESAMREMKICSIVLGEDYNKDFLNTSFNILNSKPSEIKEAYKKFIISLDEDKHSGPCWKTHKMVGMKKSRKGKGMVPNCVPRESADEDVDEFVNPKDVIRGYEKNQTFTSTLKGSEREFKQLVKDLKRAKLSAEMDGKPKKGLINFYVIGKRIDVRDAQKKLKRKYDISDFMAESLEEARMPSMKYVIYDKKTKEVYAASTKAFDKFKISDVARDNKVDKSDLVTKKMRKGQEVGTRLKESIEEAKEKEAAFSGKDSDYKKLINDLKKLKIKVRDEDEMGGFKILKITGSDFNIDKLLNKYPDLQIDEVTKCPPATQDVKLNTQNRDKAFKAEHIKYGPVNVDAPGDYYEKMAEYFDSSVDAVKKMKCENCVAFDISPSMEKCMPGSVQEDGRLGYCWMHHFKCHSERTCYTWAKGGPITTDKVSDDWGERANMSEKTMTFAQYDEALNEKQIKGLKKKADETGIPYGILKKVFDRGMAAWKGGHRPGATPHQWAFARVNSFATKSKGTWGGADKDLAKQARSAMESKEQK